MPEDTGMVWQGARLHITFDLTSVRMAISAPNEKNSKPCGRADIRAVAHMLLNKQYFTKREFILLGYSIKISECISKCIWVPLVGALTGDFLS